MPREPRRDPSNVIVGSMNMGYISDTARNRTHNLFRLKREPIQLGHSDGQISLINNIIMTNLRTYEVMKIQFTRITRIHPSSSAD